MVTPATPATRPVIPALPLRMRQLGRYLLVAFLLTPFTYRMIRNTTEMISGIIHEREHIIAGQIYLSPIAYITRLAQANATSILIFNQEDYVATLPESVGDIASLESLRVVNNPVTVLPDSIGNLVSLKDLTVQNTKLRTLPQTIGANTALTNISLQGNRITKLPDAFGSLQNLETLNLAHNDLTELPPSIGKLSKTILLDLTGNNFRTIPRYLPPNLEVLFLGGNPIPLSELEQFQIRNALNELIIYF